MAISSYGIVFKWGETKSQLNKTIAIKDIPDLGGEPNLIETTTLSDAMETFINGIQKGGAMPFTANYTKTDYNKVLADAGKSLFYAVEFGASGADGIFEWTGQHSVYVPGVGKDDVVEMKIVVAPSSKPTLKG